ncbi:MAG: hypothetical protein ACTHYV_01325 [Psychroflexus sp.]
MSKIHSAMFEFNQFLGFLAFLVILGIGFWLLIFLTAIIPYWIGGALTERLKEIKESRKNKEEA